MNVYITQGDPCGIGLDILLSLLQPNSAANCDVSACTYIGDAALLVSRAQTLQKPLPSAFLARAINIPLENSVRKALLPGVLPNNLKEVGQQVLQVLKTAHERALSTNGAIVTLPVNKHTLSAASPDFTGQTSYFASLSGNIPVTMMIGDTQLRTALVTTHIPLNVVHKNITSDSIKQTLSHAATHILHTEGKHQARICVLGLNPHASESGLLGHEEADIIIPALTQWHAEYCLTHNLPPAAIVLQGPIPADTAFLPAKRAHTDIFISMYHDQALPVVKSHCFHSAINMTLGLPYMRTSPDHGTAYDLVGSLADNIDLGSTAMAIATAVNRVQK